MGTTLTSARRSELRARAHKLDPVVIIGAKGLTDEVVAEIDRSLDAHELIKVRATTDDRRARDAWLEEICARLQAHAVQQIGKVFVVYRENPLEAKKSAPGPSPRSVARSDVPKAGAPGDAGKRRRERTSTTKARERADEFKRTSRPRSRTPSPRPESGPRRRRPRTSR